ncbi:MAG: hypothetical protein GX038_01015 [Erysipelothrix sp.]|nr:hypothetical protein [Erysipelothrix sp.]
MSKKALAKNSKMRVRKRKNKRLLIVIAFFSAILLSVSTYAWFSSTLNVKIRFIELGVDSNTGISISLDGIIFSEEVMISMDSIIIDLKETYPNHTSQWSYGLWPVSSNGIKTPDDDKFSIYVGDLVRTRERNDNGSGKRLLNTNLTNENRPKPTNSFVSFDIFFKNVTGSPFPDNLYFDETTYIDFAKDTEEDVREQMQGIMNSIRIGILKINSVPLDSSVDDIQNMKCNNECHAVIYEPFSTKHSEESIETAENYGITLVDGETIPTYAMISSGRRLEHTCGHEGTGIPLLTDYFSLQNTVTNFEDPIMQVPHAITEARVYIWVEGQDIDSLETYSKGTVLELGINFVKDTMGFEQ